MSQPVVSAIALGSNLGNSHAILAQAMEALDRHPGITIVTRSNWYTTAPMGGPSQPDYLNGCALLRVELSPQELLHTLLSTEDEFGRVRQERWGPRTLDLDILLYDNQVVTEPNLEIPHPRMTQRAFVLVPLAEIAPLWVEPVSGKTVTQLMAQVDCSSVQLSELAIQT